MKQTILLIGILLISLTSFGQSAESNALFSEGVDLYKQGKYKTAIERFTRCQALDDVEMDSLDMRKEYTKEWIAHCYYKLSDIKKAKSIGVQDYDIEPIDRGLTAKTDSIFDLANSIAANGNLSYAIQKMKEGMEMEKKALGEECYAVANSHASLSYLYANTGDMTTAFREIEIAKEMYKSLKLENTYRYGALLISEAYLYMMEGEKETYMKIGLEALSKLTKDGNAYYSELISLYNLLAVGESTPPTAKCEEYVLKLSAELDKIRDDEVYAYADYIINCCKGLMTFKYTDKALALANKGIEFIEKNTLPNGNDNFYIAMLYQRSQIYLATNRLDDSLEEVKRIISICENTLFFNRNYLDEIYLTLADIYKNKNNPTLELESAKEAYLRASIRQDDRRIVKAAAKSYMAGANSMLENNKEAIADIKDCLRLYEDLNLKETNYYAGGLSLKAEIEEDIDPEQAIADYKLSASLYKQQIPVEYDQLVSVKLGLYRIYKNMQNDEEANREMSEIEDICKDQTIPSYVKDKILAIVYNTQGDYEIMSQPGKAITYYEKAKAIVGNDSPLWLNYETKIAKGLARIGNYKDAVTRINYVLNILKDQPNMQIQYANTLASASSIYASMGDIVMMKKYNTESISLIKSIYGENSKSYAQYLSSLAYNMIGLGMYVEAQSICKEAECKMLIHYKEVDIEMISLYNGIMNMENRLGNIDKAIEYGEKARSLAEGKDYMRLILSETLSNLSNCYKDKSQYNDAMDLLKEAMALSENDGSRFNRNCAAIFGQMAMLSQEMGNYADQSTYNECMYEIMKRITDKSDPQYIIVLYQEVNKELKNRNFENAENLLNEVIESCEKSFGKYNTYTLQAKSCLAYLMLDQNNYKEGIKELEEIYDAQLKQNKFQDLNIMNTLAASYGANKQYKEQQKIAEKMLDVVRSKYGKGSQQEGNAYLYMSAAQYGLGNTKKSAEYASKACNICRNTVLSNFLFMTKTERANLWNSVSNYFMVELPTICAATTEHNEYTEVTYNAALLSKGLLLQAETNISDLIYNSDNENLKTEYTHFLSTKELYNKATSAYSTEDDLDERFNNLEKIDSLSNEVVTLEHKLMRDLNRELGSYTSTLSTTWTDIRTSLRETDMAIEFMKATFSPDSTRYYALVVTKESKKPIYIDLISERNLNDYHNFKMLSDEELREFTEALWRPILSQFPSVRNIYFTPCGELYNMPIESISQIDERYNSENGYQFSRLSSTRELTAQYKDASKNTISLYGNVQYDASSEELIENDKKYEGKTRSSYYTEIPEDADERGSIVLNSLPGTEIEIDSIRKIVDKSDKLELSAEPYKGIAASEAAIKSMSGEGNRVLHIATHGFYVPAAKVAGSKYLQSVYSIEDKDGISTYESPEDAAMLRCGLYMAGAKNSLKGDKNIGMDDGILNAREISMLNLKGLDLAVLSACETGIGDVSGEGVFGLQRGFKKAGTHSILMSLWKVDDDATAFLMREFYSRWLSGQSKSESLEYAKTQVRRQAKWSSLRYWGAFVLLDGIE